MKNWKQKAKDKIKYANYYVYEHYLDNKLFYIGKGSGKRCFHYRDRSKSWKNVVDGREKEIVVKIKRVFENENEALRYERYRIVIMSKKHNLANVEYNTKFGKYNYMPILQKTQNKNKKSSSNKLHEEKENMAINNGSYLHKEKRIVQIERLEDSLIDLLNFNKSKQHGLSNKTLNIVIATMKEKIEQLREIDHTNKLNLSEVIKKEKVEFSNNNLILAPFGSERKAFIKESVRRVGNNVLLLVSNTSFKHYSLSQYKYLKEISENKYTFKSEEDLNSGNEYIIHVMSYDEFGDKIQFNDYFVKDFTHIFCERIGSLFNYQKHMYSGNLALAVKFLFNKHNNKEIYYFDESEEILVDIKEASPDLLNQIKVYNFLNYPQIKKYTAISKYQINSIEQIRPHLKAKLNSFNYFGYKALASNKTIEGQKRIARIAEEEGYKPLVIWSTLSKYDSMTKEQLKARKELIETGHIPKPYNFLIVNSAMQEGWTLRDSKVKLAIINTINESEKVQTLGRLKHDLDTLIYRVGKNEEPNIYLNIDKKYIGVWLTRDDKKHICKELNIKDNSGRAMMWTSIKKILEKQGCVVTDSQKVIDGKRLRVSKIVMTA